jgi:hypothetical protein
MKMRWLLALGLLFTALTAHGSPVFSDADAKRFFDRWLNEGCTKAVALGAVILQVGERDLNYPEEIRERYPTPDFMHTSAHITSYMYAMEERGIIKIERLWSDVNQKWQEARVTLTPKGEVLRKRWAQGDAGDNQFCIKWGTGRFTHIGRNEEVRKGLDVFRVVMGASQIKWTPELRLLNELRADSPPLSEQRKLIALLKHDPFQSKWEMVTYDVANLDEEFKTNKVTTELERR